MTDVTMPTLGLTMEEGTITEWLKREGESVEKDEPLFVVETDKATNEVPSPASGVLQKIIAPVGATVPVRQPIAVIAGPGEAAEAPGAAPAEAAPAQPLQPSDAAPAATQPAVPAAAAQPTTQPAVPAAPPPAPSPVPQPPISAAQPPERLRISPRARRVARELGVDLSALRGSGPEGRIVEKDVRAVAQAAPVAVPPERIVASPLARKLAAEHGIDLASLRGSGPGGRIVERDILAAVAARPAAPAAPAASPPSGWPPRARRWPA
jgi:2-oxoglutarate dehydrogenase E2 component (dihydrolipoamide succinyltransferase)